MFLRQDQNEANTFFMDTLSKCGLHKTSTMGSFPLMENLALTMPSCHWLAFWAAWHLNHFQTLSSFSTCCQGTLFHSVKTMTSADNLLLQSCFEYFPLRSK